MAGMYLIGTVMRRQDPSSCGPKAGGITFRVLFPQRPEFSEILGEITLATDHRLRGTYSILHPELGEGQKAHRARYWKL